jgi:predicted RecB family nuclease
MLKVEEYPEHIIYHYGSYEAVFLKRMRREATAKRRIDRLLGRSVNVLALIYGTIYFPTFSNGLKDVASTLGFRLGSRFPLMCCLTVSTNLGRAISVQ